MIDIPGKNGKDLSLKGIGESVYGKYCVACHGPDRKGNGSSFPSIVDLKKEYKPDQAWTLFGRGETIESKELLPGGQVRGAGELSFGAIHDWAIFNSSGAEHWKLGLGGLYAFDFAPSSPAASYGSTPRGAMGFVRLVAE